jgi:hypothetical protein
LVRYRPEELEQFLREVDRDLRELVDIIIIGGAAVGLGYGSRHATKDIDLWTNPAKPFWDAVERVRARTGSTVPVSPTPIAEPPEGFEERIQRYELEGTSRLRVWLPERHDLALMKAARGEAPDLDAIVDIHRHEPLQLETLIQRFPEMMPMGPPSRFRMNFLAMIAAVFGEPVADEVDARLPRKKPLGA